MLREDFCNMNNVAENIFSEKMMSSAMRIKKIYATEMMWRNNFCNKAFVAKSIK